MMPKAIYLTLRAGTEADAELLAAIGSATFRDTFAPDNAESDMVLYLAQSFHVKRQRDELTDPRCVVLFAEHAGEAVGYATLRAGPAPDCVHAVDPIQIERIYAVKPLLGAGVGAALMQRCLDEAALRGHATVWLGVWEHNANAIAFYTRWGFTLDGTQPFMLGRDRQTDHVMSRNVLQRA